MKKVLLLLFGTVMAWGQTTQTVGRSMLGARQYSAEDDARVLKLYADLRVCDVIDGLDVVGLQGVTVMDRSIRPLWRDNVKFTHRVQGIAATLRLVPAQETSPKFATHAAERTWEAKGWGPPAELRVQTSGGRPEPGRPGSILVVDNQAHDNGFCGSNMAMGAFFGQGQRAFVGNAVCRDTDEMTLLGIPVYQDAMLSPRGINQGRMWVESRNQPIVVGGVLVFPGDVIVADNDGVAVVPRAKAEQVAKIARWVYEDDEVKRRNAFEKYKIGADWTVQGIKVSAPPSDEPLHAAPVWNK